MSVNMEIEILDSSSDSLKGYVENGFELLGCLDQMFSEGDYEDKRILLGSLFTQKLELGKDNCRTTYVNEVLDVLTRCSSDSKKGKAIISDSFSALYPTGWIY